MADRHDLPYQDSNFKELLIDTYLLPRHLWRYAKIIHLPKMAVGLLDRASRDGYELPSNLLFFIIFNTFSILPLR